MAKCIQLFKIFFINLIDVSTTTSSASWSTNLTSMIIGIIIITVLFFVLGYEITAVHFIFFVILFIIALLSSGGSSTNAIILPLPEGQVPNLIPKTTLNHIYTGEFRPDTSNDNIPLQLSRWAQAKIGTSDPDVIFPPINVELTKFEGIDGMTSQLVYKDGPLRMEKISLNAGTFVPNHSHDSTWVSTFRIKGLIYVTGPTKQMIPWKKGSLTIPPGTEHSVLSVEDSIFYTVHMSDESLLISDFIIHN